MPNTRGRARVREEQHGVSIGNLVYCWRDKEWHRGVVVDVGTDALGRNPGVRRRYVDVRLKVLDIATDAGHYHNANTGDGEAFIIDRIDEDDCYLVNKSESSGKNVYEHDNDILAPNDLTQLDFLHEPAILDALRHRYENGDIYTSSGKVLIALNPYKTLPLYSKEIMHMYSSDSTASNPPHVYSIANQAYQEMMSCKLPQSILISGESGAGKTETAKKVMQFLAFRQQRDRKEFAGDKKPSKMSIEHAVLESNPLLESFGNAKTARNDNSSRFGKYVRLWFHSNKGTLENASITTYLLERSRVVEIPIGERSYHIFYQLYAGASTSMRDLLFLNGVDSIDNDVPSFKLLRNAETSDDSVIQDCKGFESTLQAMDTVGLNQTEIENVLKIVSAILHIQEISFIHSNESGEDCAVVDPTDSKCMFHIQAVSNLLSVDREALIIALTSKQIVVGTAEKFITRLSVSAAEDSRNSLAKELYGQLFQWLVQAINLSISGRLENWQSVTPPPKSVGNGILTAGLNDSSLNGVPSSNSVDCLTSISILDIYGFEAFDCNSFEQLCINLANEKLQQQFNSEVLKGEQEMYIDEGIEWSYVDYVDNQHVLDIIEGSRDPYCPGVFPILDEYCRIPKANPISLTSALKKGMSGKKGFFECSSRVRRDRSFGIDHFAGPVVYDSSQMLQKNREYTVEEHKILLLSSKSGFVQNVMKVCSGSNVKEDQSPISDTKTMNGNVYSSTVKGRNAKFLLSTVGRGFSEQLKVLMYDLRCTHPHYIRCIKPNRESVAEHFDSSYITDQLRCSGVMETIRIACAGYPCRRSFDQVINRYGILLSRSVGQTRPSLNKLLTNDCVGNDAESVKRILEIANINGYKMGKSKVFLRYDDANRLEATKHQIFSTSATTLQAGIRRFLARKRFMELRASTITIQSYIRRKIAIRTFNELKDERMKQIIGITNVDSEQNVDGRQFDSGDEVKSAKNMDVDLNGTIHKNVSSEIDYLYVSDRSDGSDARADIDIDQNKSDAVTLESEYYTLENTIRDLYERIMKYQSVFNKHREEKGKREVPLYRKKILFESSLQFDPDNEADDEGFFFTDLWKVQLQDEIQQSNRLILDLRHELNLKSELLTLHQKQHNVLGNKLDDQLSVIESQKQQIEHLQRTIVSERELFRERNVQKAAKKLTEDVGSLRNMMSGWRIKNFMNHGDEDAEILAATGKNPAINVENSNTVKGMPTAAINVRIDTKEMDELSSGIHKPVKKHIHYHLDNLESPAAHSKADMVLKDNSPLNKQYARKLSTDSDGVVQKGGWSAIASIIEQKSDFLRKFSEKEDTFYTLPSELRFDIESLCMSLRKWDFVKQILVVVGEDEEYKMLMNAGWKSSAREDTSISVPLAAVMVYKKLIKILNLSSDYGNIYSAILRIYSSLIKEARIAIESSSNSGYEWALAWLSIATNLRSLIRYDLLSHVNLATTSGPIALILLKLIVDVRNWHVELFTAAEGLIYVEFSELVETCCSDLIFSGRDSATYSIDSEEYETPKKKIAARFSDHSFDQQVDLKALSKSDEKRSLSPRLPYVASSPASKSSKVWKTPYQQSPMRSPAAEASHRSEIIFSTIVGSLSTLINNFKRFALMPARYSNEEDLSVLHDNHSHLVVARSIIQAALASIDAELFNTILLRRECCNNHFARLVENLIEDIECWYRSTIYYTAQNTSRKCSHNATLFLVHIKQLTTFMLKQKRELVEAYSKNQNEDVILSFANDRLPYLTMPQLYRVTAMHTGDTDANENDTQEAVVALLNVLRALAATDTYNLGSSPSNLKASKGKVVISPRNSIIASMHNTLSSESSGAPLLDARLSSMGDDEDLSVIENVLDSFSVTSLNQISRT